MVEWAIRQIAAAHSTLRSLHWHCVDEFEFGVSALSYGYMCTCNQIFMWQVARYVVTKWAERISQERFNLKLPNFTQTSIPNSSAITPEMTWLAISCLKLSQKQAQCRLRRLGGEFLANGLTHDLKFYSVIENNKAHRFSGYDVTNKMFRDVCKTSLKTAQKCAKRANPPKSRIIRPRFNARPLMTRIVSA